MMPSRTVVPVGSIVVVSIALVFVPACAETSGRAFYVAPGGDDGQAGTIDRPFSSLERARDAVRALEQKRGVPAGGVTIWLRGGVYERTKVFELDERDSGAEDARVVYRAFEGEDVRIVGGRMIDPAAVTAVTDASVRNRIVSVEARDKVRQIDLAKLGITDYGQVRARGFRRPYIPAHLELFIDDAAMHLSRWPNEGTVPIGKVIDAGSVPRDEDFSDRGGKFTVDYDRPERWRAAKDIFLSGLFGYGFADDTIRVASIDPKTKTITMAQPHMYGIKSGRPWHAYYALNLLEEIDEPGEYFVDRQRGVLYFYPPGPTANVRIAVSILEEPMVAMEGVSHVTFRGLTFEAARGIGVYIERGTGNLIAGCTLRNIGIVAVCVGMGIEPDKLYRHEMTGKPVSRQLGSWHEHIYENSVFDRQAGTNHRIVGCDIYNIGAGGVSLGGGDRRTLAAARNSVENCRIHHVNRLGRSYKAGVNVDGVGNRIRHCLIYDCPGSAIYLHGNDHLIELNEVHRACLDADDMGVFYMGRDPSEQGNVIRHNFWHHNGNEHGNTCVLYFDDDSCGASVFGNVFVRCRGTPIWINHGCDHVIVNNVFFENGGTLSPGRPQRAYDWKTDELQHKRLRVDLDIVKPPYPQRYPRLIETYETPRGKGRGNDVWRNVAVRSGQFGKGSNDVKNNLVTGEDPGFVDAANMDFHFRDDALVFEKVEGFERIPLDRIGLRIDAYRRALPVAAPVFAPTSSAFLDGGFVRIRPRTKNTVVVYTLDGTTPTAKSPQYTGPIRLTATTTVRARAYHPGAPAVLSDVASRRFERIDAKRARSCKVNFQPASGPRPKGYLIDTGAAFGVHDGGHAYGWSADNTEAARRRGKMDDAVLDTLVHFSAGVVWEIAVESGTYEVVVVIGDSQYPSTDETLFVEDVEFCKGLPLAVKEFKTITKQVTVRDGKLTLRANDAPHGPRLTRVNHLSISRKQ